jgi:hypothetical protein
VDGKGITELSFAIILLAEGDETSIYGRSDPIQGEFGSQCGAV